MSAAVLFAAATAFVLGARHGLDWDHLTAIADLVGPTEGRRRSFALALWYCVGHGSVILLLGILVGLVGVRLPEGLDRVFEAIVGLTLVGLGLLVLVQIARQRTAYRFTSRWRLLIDLFRRVWLRSARTADRGRPREIVSPRFAFGRWRGPGIGRIRSRPDLVRHGGGNGLADGAGRTGSCALRSARHGRRNRRREHRRGICISPPEVSGSPEPARRPNRR